MKKISVIGDIMVEPPFMEQIGRAGGYHFTPSFLPLKEVLKDSDYVIGNLETPLAGEEAGYTSRIVSFNAPDTLAEALVAIGVDVVSTANNHCLDRGYEGLVRTNEVLDRYGIAHTGTYAKDFDGDRIHYFTLGDTKFALIAYTFATNYDINGVDAMETRTVNLFRPQYNDPPRYVRHKMYDEMPPAFGDTIAYIDSLLGRKMLWEETIKLKLAMHLPVPQIDNYLSEEEQDTWYQAVEADYAEARKNADIVLFYPHAGGQFNEEPGLYTKRLVKKSVDLGFDAVFAAHSHTSQRAEYLDNKPCFYSMGNVTMSPGTFYSVSECLPEYGLAAHLYVEDKKIQKTTFSIFKMVEENDEPLRVVPVDVLYETLEGEKRDKLVEDVKAVYTRVAGRALTGDIIAKEYDL